MWLRMCPRHSSQLKRDMPFAGFLNNTDVFCPRTWGVAGTRIGTQIDFTATNPSGPSCFCAASYTVTGTFRLVPIPLVSRRALRKCVCPIVNRTKNFHTKLFGAIRAPNPEFIEGRGASGARIEVRKPQIDQSAARSSMWSMRPSVVSSATICTAACPAVCLSSPTISSGASGGS